MKPLYLIGLLVISSLLIGVVAGQTIKSYQIDESKTSPNNCNYYAIKSLKDALNDSDLSQQQININKSDIYEKLFKLGAEC